MRQPYRVGEYVELRTNGRGHVRGLIHESWTVEGVRYLRLYSYAMRTIATNRIDRRGRLKKLPEPREPAETPEMTAGVAPPAAAGSEVVSQYATLPARVYPPNPEAGRPEPIGFVE